MTRCGWCGCNSVMVLVAHDDIVVQAGYGDTIAWRIYTCPGCKSPSLALVQSNIGGDFPSRWFPEKPLIKEYPESVPARIAEVAAEAHSSLSIGNRRAATALSRAVVEATAKEKGITKGNLIAKIDALYEQRFIYEHVRDAAHEVRFAGNEVAHGDLVDEPITKEETAEILELMDMVLDGAFIAPAKTAAQAARRAARKLGSS